MIGIFFATVNQFSIFIRTLLNNARLRMNEKMQKVYTPGSISLGNRIGIVWVIVTINSPTGRNKPIKEAIKRSLLDLYVPGEILPVTDSKCKISRMHNTSIIA
jgi:hypothetical protein